jgi:hypothetical protein
MMFPLNFLMIILNISTTEEWMMNFSMLLIEEIKNQKWETILKSQV